MAHSVVADYKVIKTRPFRLNVAADISRTFQFELPGQTESRTPMVLSYFIVGSNDFALSIEVDAVQFATRRYTNGPERSVHHIGTGPSFNVGDAAVQKTITFTALRGEAYFGDVVLWFQRRADLINNPTGGIVADYKLGTGSTPLILGGGGGTVGSYTLLLPQAIEAAGARNEPMIVKFLLVSRSNLAMRVAIDGATVSDRQYTDATERCIQDVVTGIPDRPRRKTMTFTVLQGEAVIRNVVLWFQRAADFDNAVIGEL